MAPRPPPAAKRFTFRSAMRTPEQKPYLAARLTFIGAWERSSQAVHSGLQSCAIATSRGEGSHRPSARAANETARLMSSRGVGPWVPASSLGSPSVFPSGACWRALWTPSGTGAKFVVGDGKIGVVTIHCLDHVVNLRRRNVGRLRDGVIKPLRGALRETTKKVCEVEAGETDGDEHKSVSKRFPPLIRAIQRIAR